MITVFEPNFNTENPVVRDELWDDDYDDAEYWFNGRKYRQEPDWDSMRGGHDDLESYYY